MAGDPIMRLPTFLLLVAAAMKVAGAQSAERSHRTGAIVSGVVRDSVARAPLAGATVQLVSADVGPRVGQVATSDSLGHFVLRDVPDGRYLLGFFHPALDSLYLEPTVREIRIANQRSIEADLGIPSPERVRGAVCGALSGLEGTTLFVGVVRDVTT